MTTAVPDAQVRLLGIRHHGPGSARAVLAELEEAAPDALLLECPADAEAVLHLAVADGMRPPVALLGYAVDHPERAVFHPFAAFSPEWVALCWALRAGVPVRCIDLPVREVLAPAGPDPGADELPLHGEAGEERPEAGRRPPRHRPLDPLAELATAAGYDDPERWWEDVVEHRTGHSAGPFAAIGEAMAALREVHEPDGTPADPVERRREARMRTGIRDALAAGARDVAVVCGAWHVPALAAATEPGAAARDAAVLRAGRVAAKGRPKVAVTWVPWTHRRLASATGYGAGVTAPGWYHHLFRHAGPYVVARWFAEAAQVLRRADHPASAADVVEATRLADALGVLRGRPLAGLAEVDDAARAVLGHGSDAPMRLISHDLVVGAELGAVPAATPMVPLARDLVAAQKRCRLKPEAAMRTLELDLRQPLHLARSRLLHRLTVLDVPWGVEAEGRASAGTFRETWSLRWDPELEVRLIEASGLGTTLESAATAAVLQRTRPASGLAELTALLEQCLLGGLVDALPGVLAAVEERAAVAAEVERLMAGLPALARTLRYGDVRGTEAGALERVVAGMVSRIAAGLPGACTGIDDDAAAAMAGLVRDVQAALSLLGHPEHLERWRAALVAVHERDRVHGLVQGVATRILADAGALGPPAVERRVARALSPGTPPLVAAAFVEGFLGGSAALLIHDAPLLAVVDAWMAGLPDAAFTAGLPLLRRTFGSFEAAERRVIGERLRSGQAPDTHRGPVTLDPERVAAALATVGALLGVDQ